MSLVKTSFLSSLAVIVKIGAAVLLNKILAVYVGPSGYAAIGQLQNALSVAGSLSGGLTSSGVTKGTAENFANEKLQHAVWRTAAWFTLGSTLLVSACLWLLAPWLSEKLLNGLDMTSIFYWAGLILPAIAFNNLLLAIINGKKEVRIYVESNILGSLISCSAVGAMTYVMGIKGALLALVISPALLLIATFALVSRQAWFSVGNFLGRVDKSKLRELSGFGLMGLVSTLVSPITYMCIRNYLTIFFDQEAAGYWQASWKISEIYLMLITTTLSVYYLPRLAEIKTALDLKAEIFKVYRTVIPLVIAGAITIYWVRDFIITILFSSDFNPMRELFGWQLIGDVVKIGSWVLSFIMLGRAMIKSFILTEIVFSLTFYWLTYYLVEYNGLVGVSMAYALNYVAYWLTMMFLVTREMREMSRSSVIY